MRFLTNFPLMAIVLVVYNGLAFGLAGEGTSWSAAIFKLEMISGAIWAITLGELILALGLSILFFEILKATRVGNRSIIDHLLSTIILLIFIVEFLLLPAAATSVFFLLLLMTLVDVMAGFSVSIRSATRDVSLGDGI